MTYDEQFSIVIEDDIPTDLDPELQRQLIRQKYEPETSSGTVDVIGILRIDSPTPRGIDYLVRVGSTFSGRAALTDLFRMERYRKAEGLESITAARPLFPLLRDSVTDVQCDAESLGVIARPNKNSVVVGAVDLGLDLEHRNFRNPGSNTTRVESLWDQRTDPPVNPPRYGYGRELGAPQIDAALLNGTVRELYPPSFFNSVAIDHATPVLDIAAGNGEQTSEKGVAPNATLIFVEIDPRKGSKGLYDGVDYIFSKSGTRPTVINISLGTNSGPHDGTTSLDLAFTEHLKIPNRAIVISSGNSGNDSTHASGYVAPGSRRVLEWRIREVPVEPSQMSIWFEGRSSLSISLIPPDSGVELPHVALGETATVWRGKALAGVIINRSKDPNNHDNDLEITLRPVASSGVWGVVLSSNDAMPVHFDAWIEISRQQSFFDHDSDPRKTLNGIACGPATIAVGAYDIRMPHQRALCEFSASGPTRTGSPIHLLAAPGLGVTAARKGLSNDIDSPGTSFSAPHVTGAIALMLAAVSRDVTADEIAKALCDHCAPTDDTDPQRLGAGALDGAAAVKAILSRDKGPSREP
jgi:subtilisin family serine protease